MLSYWVIKNIIKELKSLIEKEDYEKAKVKLEKLKNDLVVYLKQIFNILKFIENKTIPEELYQLIFQNVVEISLDLNGVFSDVKTIENDKEIIKKSEISVILEKLKNKDEMEFFEEFDDIMSDIEIYLEHYKEPKIQALD